MSIIRFVTLLLVSPLQAAFVATHYIVWNGSRFIGHYTGIAMVWIIRHVFVRPVVKLFGGRNDNHQIEHRY